MEAVLVIRSGHPGTQCAICTGLVGTQLCVPFSYMQTVWLQITSPCVAPHHMLRCALRDFRRSK